MAISAQRRAEINAQLQRQGAPTASTITPERRAEIQAMLGKKPVQQATQGQQGGLQGFVQGIARPFLRLGTAVPNLIEGGAKLLTGDIGGANEAFTQERDYGYLGKARPVGVSSEGEAQIGSLAKSGQFLKDVAGTGAEIGSYAVGGGAAKNVIKQGFRGAIKQGAVQGFKSGVVSGALGQGGAELARPESTFGSVIGETLKGGAIGGLTGGVIGGAAPLAGAAGRSVAGAARTTGAVASQIGRGAKRVITGVKDLAEEATYRKSLAPVLRESVEAGIPERFARKAQTYSRGTARKAEQILDAAVDKSPRPTKMPKQVAGEAIMERAGSLAKSLKTTGKKLGVAKQMLKSKSVDVTDIIDDFIKDLEELGIYRVSKNGKLIPSNPIAKDDVDALQNIYNYLIPKRKGSPLVDAGYLDDLRRYLFDEFSVGKLQQKPLGTRSLALVQKYRSSLLKKLGGVNKEYGALSKAYAEQHEALEELVKLLGYKGKLEDLSTKSLRAGEVALRMLGNAADRPTSVIQKLNTVAKKYGYKEVDSIDDLIDFADAMEDVFGTTQSRSIKGEMQRAGGSVLSGTDPRAGIVGNIERLFEKGGMGGNLAEKEKAIRALLRSVSGLKTKSGKPLVGK